MTDVIKCRVCGECKESVDFYILKSRNKVANRICKVCSIEKSKLTTLKRKANRIRNKLENKEEIYRKVSINPFYEISNLGNLWFIPNALKSKGHLSPDGYRIVKLYSPDGSKFCTNIHRLVAIAFIDNPLNLPEVNHLDGCKSNNCVSNLEWCTSKENIHHAIKLGLRTADINLRKNDLFNAEDLVKIRLLFAKGISNKAISLMYGCHHSTISKIRAGVNYPNK